MTTVIGAVPKLYTTFTNNNQQYLQNALSDTDAVNILLNNNTTTGWSNSTMNMGATGTNAIGNYLNLTTSSNKTLVTITGVPQVPVGGSTVNGMSFDSSQTDVIYVEKIQYRIDSSNDGNYETENTGNISLAGLDHGVIFSEIPSTSQSDLNIQGEFRARQTNGVLNGVENAINSYSDLDVTKSFGVEGLLIGESQNYSDVVTLNNKIVTTTSQPFGSLADSNISVTRTVPTTSYTMNTNATSSDNMNPNDFGTYKISWGDANFTLTNNTNGSALTNNIVHNDGAQVGSLETFTYNDFAGANYPSGVVGGMSTADYNALLSSTAKISVHPLYSSGKQFEPSPENGQGSVVSISNTRVNLDNLTPADSYPKTEVTVTIDPTGADLTADSTVNNSNLVVSLVHPEILPAGATNTDATVTFDSSVRFTNNLASGQNFSPSIHVYYSSDSNVPVSIGSLSENDMKTETVSYTGSILTPSTINSQNMATLHGSVVPDTDPIIYVNGSVDKNNMIFYPTNNVTPILNSVDTNNNNIFGAVILANTLKLAETANDLELICIDADAQTLGNYVLSSTNNSVHGSEINVTESTINADIVIGGEGSNGLRLHFTPLDMFSDATLSVTNTNLLETTQPQFVRQQSNLIVYDINMDSTGPVSIYSLPSAGIYKQTYTVEFTGNEMYLDYNSKNSGLQTVVPLQVKVNAFSVSNSVETKITETEKDIPIITTGNAKNFNNFSYTDSNGVRTVTATIKVPLSISGVVDTTGSIDIPIKYEYHLTGSQYNNGPMWLKDSGNQSLIPSCVVSASFMAQKVKYTHEVVFQGSRDTVNNNPSDGTWQNLGSGSTTTKMVDLRLINKSVTLSYTTDYNIVFDIYPSDDINSPSFYSVEYVLGVQWLSGGWVVKYASFNDNMQLLESRKVLSKDNINWMITHANNVIEIPITDSNITNTTIDEINAKKYTISDSNISFEVTMKVVDTTSLFFARCYETLVNINGQVMFINNGDVVKVADGISVSFDTVQGPSLVNQALLDISLNKDKFVAVAYTGQSGQSYNTLGPIPSDLSIITPDQAHTVNLNLSNYKCYLLNEDYVTGAFNKIVFNNQQATSLTIPGFAVYNADGFIILDQWNTPVTLPYSYSYLFVNLPDLAEPIIVVINSTTSPGQFMCKIPGHLNASAVKNYYDMTTVQNISYIIGNGNQLVYTSVIPATYRLSTISSQIYRGYPNGQIYHFHRGQMNIDVSWGSYTQSFSKDAPGLNSSISLTFDSTPMFGMGITISSAPSTLQIEKFLPNISRYDIYLNNVLKLSGNTESFTIQASTLVPWIEKFKFNHFYMDTNAYVLISYNQSNIVIDKRSYITGLATDNLPTLIEAKNDWSNVRNVSEPDLLVNGSNLSYANFTLHFSNLAHRNVAKHFYWTVAPMLLDVQYFSTSTTITNTVTSAELWKQISLPSANKLTSFTIQFCTGGTISQTMKVFGSNDNTTWSLLNEGTVSCSSSGIRINNYYFTDLTTVNVNNNTNYKYYRFTYPNQSFTFALVLYNDATSFFTDSISYSSGPDWVNYGSTVSSSSMSFPVNVTTIGGVGQKTARYEPGTPSNITYSQTIAIPTIYDNYFVDQEVKTIPLQAVKCNIIVDTKGTEIPLVLSQGVRAFYMIRKPYLISISGTQDDGISWIDYVIKQPFDHLVWPVQQHGTTTSAVPQMIYVTFSSLSLPRLYATVTDAILSSNTDSSGGIDVTNSWNNYTKGTTTGGVFSTQYGWSGQLTLDAITNCYLTQYVLRFELESVTNAPVPVVYKMISKTFNQRYLGPSSGGNVDYAGGTLDINGGFRRQFEVCQICTDPANPPVSKCVLSSLKFKLGYPYNFSDSNDYPALGSITASMIGTVQFTTIDTSDVMYPQCLDLILQVKDYTLSSSGVKTVQSSNPGTNAYYNLFGVIGNQKKYFLLFAKDQFVVKNYLGKLSTRVGPDGRLYTSDVITYGLYVNDNLSETINGSMNNVSNTQLGLNQKSYGLNTQLGVI